MDVKGRWGGDQPVVGMSALNQDCALGWSGWGFCGREGWRRVYPLGPASSPGWLVAPTAPGAVAVGIEVGGLGRAVAVRVGVVMRVRRVRGLCIVGDVACGVV